MYRIRLFFLGGGVQKFLIFFWVLDIADFFLGGGWQTVDAVSKPLYEKNESTPPPPPPPLGMGAAAIESPHRRTAGKTC